MKMNVVIQLENPSRTTYSKGKYDPQSGGEGLGINIGEICSQDSGKPKKKST